MAVLLCVSKSVFASRKLWARVATLNFALVLALLALSLQATAQTTTISGNVYDPRTTNALPLPNVLVYVTTGPVGPLPAGAQCLRYTGPSGAVSYAYTAVDGSFTIKKVPVNTAYTLVIQAGKWRRQFPQTVGTAAVSGLSLHMPSNHLEGDIPLIAIATGAYDGVECVLRAMGIADSEFTDDTGATNPGGRIHLYQGSGMAGAYISPSTPRDTTLTGNSSTLNSYDVVMFPCQGAPYIQSNTALTNMVNFANAGGRMFGTHFSYVWLDPDSPYDSQFPPVANWHPEFTYPQPDPGVGTVNTGFTDGATLAQWLQNAGADYQGQPGQVQISTLRHDVDGVIPPTQSWLTLNDPTDSNPVMQFTFNAPVGAPAANQCGRVLYNEYHVINLNLSGSGPAFPQECPAGPMDAQEEMLEYALFDLSAFVQPIVVPTLSITFNPSPLAVKQYDTADQVTINVNNTSTNTAIDPSAALSITLPPGLTATQISDPTNGWNCKLNTLTCTRTTSISSSVTDPVTLTVSVGAYPLAAYTGLLKATVSSPTFANDVTATDEVDFQHPLSNAISLVPTPNPAFVSNAVRITASIPSQSVAPTGTITFYDGETQLGSSAVVNGSATMSTSALAMGSHTISAIYSGDANYLSSTSAGVKETIMDFSIAAAPGSSATPPVNPGSPASFSLVVTPLGGSAMPAPLNLSASGLPPTSSVVFAPANVAANSATTTITMIVTPPALGAARSGPNPFGKGTLPMALGLVLLPLACRIRRAHRWIQMLVFAIAGMALAAGVAGCSSFTYTPQSFSVNVAATSGNLSHTTTVKLTVK